MTPVEYEPGFKKTVRWTLFTDGAIIVLIGVFGALSRVKEVIPLKTLIGVGLLISALNYLVPYFALKNSVFRPNWFMALGAIDGLFGVLCLTRIGFILFSFPVLIGIWIIFSACARFYMAFLNFRAGIGKWWITLVVSAYMLLASASMMANTSDTIWFLSWNTLIIMGAAIINEGRMLFRG